MPLQLPNFYPLCPVFSPSFPFSLLPFFLPPFRSLLIYLPVLTHSFTVHPLCLHLSYLYFRRSISSMSTLHPPPLLVSPPPPTTAYLLLHFDQINPSSYVVSYRFEHMCRSGVHELKKNSFFFFKHLFQTVD